jgi:hypothetical protein
MFWGMRVICHFVVIGMIIFRPKCVWPLYAFRRDCMAMSSNAVRYAFSRAYIMHMDPSMTAMAYCAQMHKDATTYLGMCI